jgi:hypothetical protein
VKSSRLSYFCFISSFLVDFKVKVKVRSSIFSIGQPTFDIKYSDFLDKVQLLNMLLLG